MKLHTYRQKNCWTLLPDRKLTRSSRYADQNGDTAVVPIGLRVSEKEDEQAIDSGLVIIGPDDNEFVWIPVTEITFTCNDFGSYGFYDEIYSKEYKTMKTSTDRYGGFYMERYEASHADGDFPASKKADSASIWVHILTQEMIPICESLYVDNKSVSCFLPWEINWDTTLQWLNIRAAKQKLRLYLIVPTGKTTATIPSLMKEVMMQLVSGKIRRRTIFMILRVTTENGRRKGQAAEAMLPERAGTGL
jgi:hypothetical protein